MFVEKKKKTWASRIVPEQSSVCDLGDTRLWGVGRHRDGANKGSGLCGDETLLLLYSASSAVGSLKMPVEVFEERRCHDPPPL